MIGPTKKQMPEVNKMLKEKDTEIERLRKLIFDVYMEGYNKGQYDSRRCIEDDQESWRTSGSQHFLKEE